MRVLVLAALVGCHPSPRPTPPLISTGEASHWTATGRYAEAVQMCHDFAARYSRVTCGEIGRTAEDRPIVALEVGRHELPAIYIEAGIHAGEIEGKDAGFWFLRDVLDGKIAVGVLDHVRLIFVPVVSPDGHERFGPNNRPNQRGPIEMGFRTNAQRFNINRDFMKADTEEMHAILEVLRANEPLVVVDLHTTDGAKFEHDVSIVIDPIVAQPDQLDRTAQALSGELVARLTVLGHLPIGGWYPSLVKPDDPTSGFAVGAAPPRFSTPYAGTRNRIGILVETHSWKPYAQRVATTYHVLQALCERALTDVPAWRAAEQRADEAAAHLGGSELPVTFENTKHTTTLAFHGYAYERRPSELSTATWIVYDESKPQIWNIPLLDEVVPKLTVRVPKQGYVIDGGYAKLVAASLDAHGIHYTRIARDITTTFEVFRATKTTFQPPFEGHTRLVAEGTWKPESRTLDRGAIFVPIAQPLARVIVQLLDPAAPDSLAAWGFFNTAFERKEYMEEYLTEELARSMIAKDPAIGTAFDAAVAADPELAKSSDKRLEWFYRRTPAWDERMDLLPVYKVDAVLVTQ